MRCEQIMKRSVKYASDRDSVHSVAMLMRDQNIGFVPVCDMDGKVVGVVTDRDIVVRLGAERGSFDAPVTSIMTRELVTCMAKDNVSFAETRMRDRQKSRILCIDDRGKPVGVISLSDLAQRRRAGRIGRVLRALTTREAHV